MKTAITRDLEPSLIDYTINFAPEDIFTTPQEVSRYFGGSRYKMDHRLHGLVTAVIEQAMHLSAPALVYALHPVKALTPQGRLLLENGIFLEVPRAERDPHTRCLASCVCSLGGALENSSRELADGGHLFKAMLLDAVGVSLLDALVNKSQEQLHQWARKMQLFAGCRFGPGYGDLPMETQSFLFQQVDADAIQVRLNDSMVMEPAKSLSFFVRLSARKTQDGHAHKCRHCSMKHCQFRVDHSSNG